MNCIDKQKCLPKFLFIVFSLFLAAQSVAQDYDLAISKTIFTPGPHDPGDLIVFHIVVENQGMLPASNIVVAENSSSDLNYISSTVDPNVTDNFNETFTIWNLAQGATQLIEVIYQIDANFGGTAIPNYTQITADDGDDVDSNPDVDYTADEDGDGDPIDDDEAAVIVPVEQPNNFYDLTLTKTLITSGTLSPGDVISFAIEVENEGTIPASMIQLEDISDPNLNYSNSSLYANVIDNGNETFTILSLPPGESQIIQVFYEIDPNFTGTSLINAAQITGDNGNDVDSDPSTDNTIDEDGDGNPDDDDEDFVTVNIGLPYDLAIFKTVTSVGPFMPGSNLFYGVVVTNQGQVQANNIQIVDSPDPGLVYVSSNAASSPNVNELSNLLFEIATLAPGESQAIILTFSVDQNFTGTTLENNVQIIADDGEDIDSNPATDNTVDEDGDGSGIDDDEFGVSITVEQPAEIFDLALTKVLTSAGPHAPGDVISFELTVINQGNVDATSTVVTDYNPSELIYQSSTSNANVIDNGDGIFEVLNLLAPQSGSGTAMETIEVFYQIDPATTATSLINDAEITSDSGDDIDSMPADDATPDDLANNDDVTDSSGGDDQDPAEVIITQPVPVFDLALTKELNAPGPYSPGDAIGFLITVYNQGDIAATNTIVTDYSPNGLIYLSSTADANLIDNNDGSWEVLNLAPMSQQVIEVFYQIDPATLQTSMINDAEITADSGDDVDSTPGDNATPINTPNDNDVADTAGGDDQDPAEFLITQDQDVYDLALTKVLTSAGPFMPGDVISFDIIVDNQGMLPASNVSVADNSPVDLIYQSSTASANVVDNGNETFSILNIAASSSQVIEVFYLIDPNYTGTELVNSAQITGDNGDDVDSDPTTNNTIDENGDGAGDDDDEDEEMVPVGQNQSIYDLAIDKSLASTGPFAPGDIVVYHMVVTNEGTLPAANIIVADESPADLVYINSTSDANVVDQGDESFVLLNLGAGDSQLIEAFYQIDAAFTGASLVNTAQIISDNGDDVDSDPNTDETVDENGDGNGDDDDEDIQTLVLGMSADLYDLALAKTLTSVGPFVPGDLLSFDIILSNQGMQSASNIVVADNSPTGLSFVGSTSDANVIDNLNETFTVLNVAPNETQVIEVFYIIDANFTGTSLINTAEITSDDGDDVDSNPNTGNTLDEDGDGNGDDDDEDAVSIIVDQYNPIYDLALNKTVTSTGPFVPGDIVTFEISVNNEGGVPSNVVTVQDLLPTGLIYQGLTNNPNVSDDGGGVFTVTNVATGSGVSMELTYMIDPNFSGGTIVNNAEIVEDDGDDIDSDPSTGNTIDEDGDGNGDDDDEDSSSIDVMSLQDVYDLALTKTLTTAGPFTPGDLVVFDVVVENQGGIDANSIEVTQTSSAGLTYQYINVDANVTDNGDGTFTIWTIPATENQTIQLTYEIDPDFTGSSLNSYVFISADDGDDIDSSPNTDETVDEDGDGDGDDDDEDWSIITINGSQEFDLALTKAYTTYTDLNTDGVLSAGDDVVFTVTVENQGGIDASNVEVVDYLPIGTSLSSNDSNGWTENSVGASYTFISIPVSSPTVTVEIVLNINPSFSETSLVNWAEISEDNNDDSDSTADTNNTDAYGGTDITDGTGGDEDDHDDAQVDVEQVLGSIGQLIWKDQNANGMQDFGEPGIANVTVDLYDCTGNFIESETTSTSGGYLFDNLTPGDYEIRIDLASLPAGCVPTMENQGGDFFDSDFNDQGATPCITLLAGENNMNIAAGFIELASLGNFVWEDLNGNGIQDAGEPGVEGIEVILRNSNGVAVSVQYTDVNGIYLFENLNPASYYIEFNLPFGYSVTLPNLDSNNTTDSDVDNSNGSNTTPFTNLSAGENDLSWDAGIYKCIPIGDLAWMDLNENNIQDEAENGVNGLRVNLFRQMANGQYILWDYTHTDHNTETASEDGYFKFCAPPGTYYLEFVNPPTGLVAAQPNAGADDVDSDITGGNGPGTTDSFAVLSGEEKCDLAAGYYAMGTLGDFVFLDDNQNGLRDPNESGLGNVYIQAFNQEGQLMGEATTKPDGSYMMDYLQQTDVYLKFYPPGGYSATLPHMGPEYMDSDIDNSNGPMTTEYYNIKSGEHMAHVDAGMVYGVVPVSWVAFEGEHRQSHNWLEWTLAMEFGVSHYEVERSFDNVSEFEPIGKVISLSNNTAETSYNYEDYSITEVGTYYYRIKQVDLNGDYSYSSMIALQTKGEGSSLGTARIYPNPSIGEFSLDIQIFEPTKNISYLIYDNNGKLAVPRTVLANDVDFGKHMFLVDEDQLMPGVYTIQLNIGTTILKKKLIVIQ